MNYSLNSVLSQRPGLTGSLFYSIPLYSSSVAIRKLSELLSFYDSRYSNASDFGFTSNQAISEFIHRYAHLDVISFKDQLPKILSVLGNPISVKDVLFKHFNYTPKTREYSPWEINLLRRIMIVTGKQRVF